MLHRQLYHMHCAARDNAPVVPPPSHPLPCPPSRTLGTGLICGASRTRRPTASPSPPFSRHGTRCPACAWSGALCRYGKRETVGGVVMVWAMLGHYKGIHEGYEIADYNPEAKPLHPSQHVPSSFRSASSPPPCIPPSLQLTKLAGRLCPASCAAAHRELTVRLARMVVKDSGGRPVLTQASAVFTQMWAKSVVIRDVPRDPPVPILMPSLFLAHTLHNCSHTPHPRNTWSTAAWTRGGTPRLWPWPSRPSVPPPPYKAQPRRLQPPPRPQHTAARGPAARGRSGQPPSQVVAPLGAVGAASLSGSGSSGGSRGSLPLR